MTTTTPSNPNALAERWLVARLGTDGGFRADKVIAHGKRDGYSEASLREAHRKLGFVKFAEPGTGQEVWSSFMKCMAEPDANGKIVWAESTPMGTHQASERAAPQPPIAAATTTTSYRPPAPVAAAAPQLPPLINARLRARMDATLWQEPVSGREVMALAAIAQPGIADDKILDLLRASTPVLNESTRNLGARIRALAWCRESYGRETKTLHLIQKTDVSVKAAIETLRVEPQDARRSHPPTTTAAEDFESRSNACRGRAAPSAHTPAASPPTDHPLDDDFARRRAEAHGQR